MTPLDRYVAAWNAGDLEAWLGVHADGVEHVSFAGPEPRLFTGEEGLREMWAESRANWHRFEFSVLDDEGEVAEVMFSGIEMQEGTEISGVLWFRVKSRDGKIARVESALDATRLP